MIVTVQKQNSQKQAEDGEGRMDLIARAQPLFVIGAPRSGTTFLCHLLNSHPEILLTNETAVFLQLSEVIQKSFQGVRAGLLYGKQENELWAGYLQARARNMIQDYYGLIARKQQRGPLRYWGEKHPHFSQCLSWLDTQFPESVYVYLVRDPRDSACSMAEMNKASHRDALLNWLHFAMKYEIFAAGLPEDRLIPVRYEDLIRDPRAQIRQILEKLDLPYAEEIEQFLGKYKDIDAHQILSVRPAKKDFQKDSLARWKKEMCPADQRFAEEMLGYFLAKYRYERTGQTFPAAGLRPVFRMRSAAKPSPEPAPGKRCVQEAVDFECNICSHRNLAFLGSLDREKCSCSSCGSSVRLRSVIHLLSRELFGHSVPLPAFPVRKDMRGIGMSDWEGYAKKLSEKLGYTNTFYHRQPRLDIAATADPPYKNLNFLISSDVFEHVKPPVERIFDNARSLLKPGGFMILTVPYIIRARETIEHFPGLYDFTVEKDSRGYVLRNTRQDGRVEEFRDLKFHGGQGSTLELRVFAYPSLLKILKDSGFTQVTTCDDAYLKYGIFWRLPYSLPIVARRE